MEAGGGAARRARSGDGEVSGMGGGELGEECSENFRLAANLDTFEIGVPGVATGVLTGESVTVDRNLLFLWNPLLTCSELALEVTHTPVAEELTQQNSIISLIN